MRKLIIILMAIATSTVHAQDKKAPTLKSILLEQLRTTHNVKDWFVPVNIALEDVTPDQAKWTDGSGNHSIGQLASHRVQGVLRDALKKVVDRGKVVREVALPHARRFGDARLCELLRATLGQQGESGLEYLGFCVHLVIIPNTLVGLPGVLKRTSPSLPK
jgi:hypothetical protein